jgi:hypothetical protein
MPSSYNCRLDHAGLPVIADIGEGTVLVMTISEEGDEIGNLKEWVPRFCFSLQGVNCLYGCRPALRMLNGSHPHVKYSASQCISMTLPFHSSFFCGLFFGS